MKNLLILGGGTAGSIAANKLRRRLPTDRWAVTVVDSDDDHRYQPGFLFVPFGTYRPDQVTRSRRRYLSGDVDLVYARIERVVPDEHVVELSDGRRLPYDALIIASGVTPRPDQTPGLLGEEWGRTIHEFYTYDGSVALARALSTWPGGRLVTSVVEMPIKCPVAPLEFAFLADSHFEERGIRDRVELTYVTPLPGAFTKPIAAKAFGSTLSDKGIDVEPDFMLMEVDPERRVLVSYDEREVPYDLLVVVPVNMGADFVAASGLGNELNLVPVDKQTLQSKAHPDVFALGDANDIPTSKAGSVAHFAIDVFVENFVEYATGRPMTHAFDGHANCFIETGHGKAMLIDFNYDTEPLPGRFPVAGLGPMSLLKQTRLNHLGKLAFEWIYWNVLLPGRPLPLPADMSLAGKRTDLLTTVRS